MFGSSRPKPEDKKREEKKMKDKAENKENQATLVDGKKD